jgi:hypothetical protein
MPGKRLNRKAITAKQAMLSANKFILFHYPTMFTGGLPHRLALPTGDVWIVPLVLTHPDCGIIGEVGSIAVDFFTAEIVGNTARNEAVATGKRLREAKGPALETAFLSTRTV